MRKSIYKDPKNFLVTMDAELVKRIDEAAHAEQMSRTAWLNSAAKEKLKRAGAGELSCFGIPGL